MKKIILSGVMMIQFAALSAIAAPTGIKIDSWRRMGNNDPQNTAAEVCGHVLGTLNGTERVLLQVDPRGDVAEYTTLLSPTGRFCQVVSSYTGQIQADVRNGGSHKLMSIGLSKFSKE